MSEPSLASRQAGSVVTFEALFVAASRTAPGLAAAHARAQQLAADLATGPAWLTAAYPGAAVLRSSVAWIRSLHPPPARRPPSPMRAPPRQPQPAVAALLLVGRTSCRSKLGEPSAWTLRWVPATWPPCASHLAGHVAAADLAQTGTAGAPSSGPAPSPRSPPLPPSRSLCHREALLVWPTRRRGRARAQRGLQLH